MRKLQNRLPACGSRFYAGLVVSPWRAGCAQCLHALVLLQGRDVYWKSVFGRRRTGAIELRRAAVQQFHALATGEDCKDATLSSRRSLSTATLALLMLFCLVLHCQDCGNNSRLQKRFVGTMQIVNTTSILRVLLLTCIRATSAATQRGNKLAVTGN